MSKPLSLFSDQVLAAARAPASVKAPESGEFDHLNPDGSKKHKQLAARRELLTGNTDNGSSRTVYVAKQLLARDDNDGIIDELPEPDGNSSTVQYLNELSMGQEQLNAKASKPPDQKPPQDAPAVEARKKSKQPAHNYETEEGEAARRNGGIHL